MYIESYLKNMRAMITNKNEFIWKSEEPKVIITVFTFEADQKKKRDKEVTPSLRKTFKLQVYLFLTS